MSFAKAIFVFTIILDSVQNNFTINDETYDLT